MIYKDIILKGTLIKRYKRFFADVKVNNETLTTYCPNTGSLKGLLDEGNEVLVAKVDNPKAKLKYRLEAIRSNDVFVGINTSLPNLIISESIVDKKLLKEFTGTLRREVKYGVNSKIDILLEENNHKNFIEIKSVTMSREKGIAEFPDSITSRGSKHLIELSKTVSANTKCYLIYLIQRTDIKSFRIAKDIDKEYYENSLIAKKNGVKFIAYSCNVNEQGIEIKKKLKLLMIKTYKSSEIDACREASKISSMVLDEVIDLIEVGNTTEDIDDFCFKRIKELGATPAPLFYRGFTKVSCTSLNHVICHGIPSKDKLLKKGDILNIDVTSIIDGWHGDTSRMLKTDEMIFKAQNLMKSSSVFNGSYRSD